MVAAESDGTGRGPFPWWRFAAAALLPVVLLLPFLNKAVHIDDPLFIWSAQQILETPLDFYGFEQNWYVSPQPMHEINQNPPLVAYWLAPVGGVFGWDEWKLNLAMIPWAVLAAGAMFLVARHFRLPPLAASVLLVVSPGFLVSAASLMTDVPMVALWLAATAAWLRGLERAHHGILALAGVLMGLAILTKYFAISLLPLLLVYTLLAEPRFRRSVAWLAVPVAMMIVYELWTWHLYGTGLFFDAVFYASSYEADHPVSPVEKAVSGIVFVGAALLPATLWLGCMGDWQFRIGRLLLVAVAAIAGLVAVHLAALYPHQIPALSPFVMAQWGVGFGLGAVALFVLSVRAAQWRDPFAALLVLWVGGTLVFACFLNHYVNVRVVLPLAPALILAGLRAVGGRAAWPQMAQVGGLSLAVALLVAHGDYRLANAQRDAVEEIGWLDLTSPLSFAGHWGFQYYMEEAGAEILDIATMEVLPGQTVVVPGNNTNIVALREELVGDWGHMFVPVRAWAATMHTARGAGFYSDVWGPLPFAFGPVPDEEYGIAIMRHTAPGAVRHE